MNTCILPVCYLAPIEYYSVLLKSSTVIFEIHEHFVKQTYRNRCEIYGANGKLNLIIPVKHTGERTKMKDVKIANENNWQKIHWKSIESSYRSSSYFEFYEHIFRQYYEKKFEFLIDFNFELLNKILKILARPLPLPKGWEIYTNSYQKTYPNDYRNYFFRQQETKNQKQIYSQVFADKFGFIQNLSIIDLIFNEGNSSANYLSAYN